MGINLNLLGLPLRWILCSGGEEAEITGEELKLMQSTVARRTNWKRINFYRGYSRRKGFVVVQIYDVTTQHLSYFCLENGTFQMKCNRLEIFSFSRIKGSGLYMPLHLFILCIL